MKKKIVFFTGSGISSESGIPTFRDNDGLWEQYPVQMVASAHGYWSDPEFVNGFYNELREKYNGEDIKPCSAHLDISKFTDDYDVTVITQNVDDLHEQAFKQNNKNVKVIHLHGELNKMCADGRINDEKYHITLPYNGELNLKPDTRVKDIFPDETDEKIREMRMRPFIVFFGEDVPNMSKAIDEVKSCDIFVVIGTSLQVYPAASLLEYVQFDNPIIYIDPKPHTPEVNVIGDLNIIQKTASDGMKDLLENWNKYIIKTYE